MADNFTKFLRKLSRKDKEIVLTIYRQILARDFTGLHIRKLVGQKDIFRVRYGRIRIIYWDNGKDIPEILKATFRDDSTYREF